MVSAGSIESAADERYHADELCRFKSYHERKASLMVFQDFHEPQNRQSSSESIQDLELYRLICHFEQLSPRKLFCNLTHL